MEYNSYRRVAWYWKFSFTVFSIAVIALVLINNPFLYDQIDYKLALSKRKNEHSQPIPSLLKQKPFSLDRGKPSEFGPLSHSGIEPNPKIWSHNFYNVAVNSLHVKINDEGLLSLFNGQVFSQGELSLKKIDGEKWQFNFLKNTSTLYPPTFDLAATYTALADGKIFSILSSTGQMLWMNDLNVHIYSAPFLVGEKVFVFTNSQDPLRVRLNQKVLKKEKDVPMKKMGLHLVSLKRAHGDIDRTFPISPELDEAPVEISLDDSEEMLFVSQNQKIIAYDFATMKLLWQITLPSSPLKPPTIEGDNLFATTKTGQIVSYSLRGRKNWETEFENNLSTIQAFVPSYNLLAVISPNHMLDVLDAKTGEKKWHFQLETDLTHAWAFSFRLNAQSINETKIRWANKGWVLGAPCMKTRICLFNPENGQVIGRMSLHGRPLLRPSVIEGKYLTYLTAGLEGDLKIETVVDKSGYAKWRLQHGKDLSVEPSEDSF